MAWLCQLISNRYYPTTQSDRRTIQVSGWSESLIDGEEDWDDYVRRWSEENVAHTLLHDLGLRDEEVSTMLEAVRFEARLADPLDDWYSFVSFISLDQKQRLKGAAQLGQHLWSMESMLRQFYGELTGTDIPRPHESGEWLKTLYGPDVPGNIFAFLEGLANHYHVNPRPRLTLIVEGESEETAIPWLAEELMGVAFNTLQIQVVNFHGIDNIAGPKREAGLGLSQLIDFQHRQNTIVYCILDREGNADKAVSRLLKAVSVLDGVRKVTKGDYVRVWNKNIEFDNFSFEEIARGLTDVAEGVADFDPDEVETCNSRKDPGSCLKTLYWNKTGRDLNKPKLLRTLLSYLVENRDQELAAKTRRPIVQATIDIVKYAASNFPPVGPDVRAKNVESGAFG